MINTVPPICQYLFCFFPRQKSARYLTKIGKTHQKLLKINDRVLVSKSNDQHCAINSPSVDTIGKPWEKPLKIVSDDDTSKGRKKNNKKTNGCTTDVDKPSKRTRRKISDLATEFLQDKSDIN
ncbi:hypothetical protein RIR_jg5866.t1 [Rhizophagus irregularis DAOM 181602=DAOM 197198]|uniref:Uncharacterized protein n=1 Tax=Rhizophagus irregularis (strain DAOM 181602 / DAOM 197198 / MUCL 43194) TaxID=747089 RepID=U9TS17_RHIID|nr:hypothetical protein RIR_jg5866.t1 [Rhizophagus irregularis DAOM 181602=DAOM 197198]